MIFGGKGDPRGRSFFFSFEAYTYWRQVEVEGPDYWERFASVLMHWEQLSVLVDEYMGEMVVDVRLDDGAPRPAG